MLHKILTINEYVIDIDYSVEKVVKSFKEEVLDELYNLHRTHGINDLLFSGGMDSTFILRSLMELGIKPNLHAFVFCNNYDGYDIVQIKKRCEKYGFKEPNYFPIDPAPFFDHVNNLTHQNKVFTALHQYYIDYFLNSNKLKFFTGLGAEYRLENKHLTLGVPPIINKLNNPNRLFDFTSDKTFLAYVNDSILKDNYCKVNPDTYYGENVWYIRDLIYQNCYSDIEIVEKKPPGDAELANHFDDYYVPLLRERFPIMFCIEKYRFDLEKYYTKNLKGEKNEYS